jgi:hypothetical protein
MMLTAVIYFIVTSQELTSTPSSADDKLSSEVQMVFFVIWGIAYIPVGIWMVARTKLANRITRPYIIAIAGSAAYSIIWCIKND